MVISVMSRPVNKGLKELRHSIVPVVYRNGPNIDKDKENEIEDFVQGEKERINVIREALQPAVDRMKGMACEWSRDLPLVMPFVHVLIKERRVKKTMYPINETVGEHEERYYC